MQVYTTDETNRKVKEIKKKIPTFKAAEEFRKLIDKTHDEISGEDLTNLKKQKSELSERKKQLISNEKEIEEKIKIAKREEPKKRQLEEENKRKYEQMISNHMNNLLNKWVMNKEDAERIARKFLAMSPSQHKDLHIDDLAIQENFRLTSEGLKRAHSFKDNYDFLVNRGYQF